MLLRDHLREMVCQSGVDLGSAQQGLLTDWIAPARNMFDREKPSKVKPVPQLEIDHSRVIPVRAAESVAGVLKVAIVGQVRRIQGE
jgi:hypothetical protein